ncbi:MAG: autotransporter assembly complex protein TamA [Pseudomonadales bacterium]
MANLSVAADQDITILVTGIKGKLKENVLLHIGNHSGAELANRRSLYADVHAQCEQALQAMGYFNANITVEEVTEKKTPLLKVVIDKGRAVLIRALNVQITGAGANDTALHKTIDEWRIKNNGVFNSAKYARSKDQLLTVALQNGYLDANYSYHKVLINRQENSAAVTLKFDSGQRYRFTDATISGTRLKAKVTDKFVGWKHGDFYSSEKIIEYRRHLLDSRYFNKVQVETLPDRLSGEAKVAADVTMARRNNLGVGVGFGTDTGPRGKFGWVKPWINSRGHSAGGSIGLSNIHTKFNANYQVPVNSAIDRYFQLDLNIEKVDFEDTISDKQNISLRYHTPFRTHWNTDVFVRQAFESFEQGEQDDRSQLLIPGIAFDSTIAKGGLIPQSGRRYSFLAEFAHEDLLSDASFVRLVANGKWLRSRGKHRLLTEVQLGAIEFLDSSKLQDLPPSLRFFAGGDNSIRGYGYKSLAPEDENGDLVGGQYLSVARLEYGYRFKPSWRTVLFVDGGKAFSNSSDKTYIGPGIGLHWLSPIGSVRFDLAASVSDDDNRMRFHMTLGPEL